MISRDERYILLLCSTLGQPGARPLSAAGLRRLRLRLEVSGLDGLQRALQLPDLKRMGYPEPEAVHIMELLDREQLLDRYLRQAEGIYPLVCVSSRYPLRLRQQLGESCPPLLFCRGDLSLLERPCVSLVGSRELQETGRSFARRVGALAAREDLTLVSGGARGADLEAQTACLAAGGRAAIFVAGSLLDFPDAPGLLTVSETGFDEPFHAARALSRNRLIHAAGRLTLAAQTGYGSGGTWSGCMENLKRGWSPVFVCDDGSPGARGLLACGASPVPPDGPASLRDLRPAQTQLSLF